MRKMLGSKHIPLNLRRQAVISLLLPALAYGGELFGLQSPAKTHNLLKPLESVLKHALAMMASASYSIKQGTPMGTTDAILREEFGVQSVAATMAGMAARSRIKYQAPPGLISWIIKSRPPKAAIKGAWPGTMEQSAEKLSKWFGITTAAADWRQQPPYAYDRMGEFPANVVEAAAGGPMTADTLAAADPSTSKTEGRRMRTLANEQQFRRISCKTTDNYAVSGYRQSAKAVIQLAGMHPNLAAGFHHVSKARQGSFITWKQANKLVTSTKFFGKLASDTDKEGCPCCKKNDVADSFGHFIFDCDNKDLKEIRKKTGIKEFAAQLAKEVSRQQTGSSSSKNTNNIRTRHNNNNILHVQDVRVTRSATTYNADTLAKLLLGGRASLQNTGSTAATPTSPETSVFDLQNWQQVQGNKDHTKLQETIDKILKVEVADDKRREKKKTKKTKKKKKIQMEQPLFEASTVILAQYLQAGMIVRTKVLWDLSASSQRSNVGQS